MSIMGIISLTNSNDSDHFFVGIFVAVRQSLSNLVLQYTVFSRTF